jgi:hypothetical protein
MHTTISLSIEVAPLTPVGSALQPLRGIEVRHVRMTHRYQPSDAVSDTAWLGVQNHTSQRMELELEGVVGTDTAMTTLRAAAVQGLGMRARIGWPAIGSHDGAIYVAEYQEYAEGFDVLRFRAKLQSSGVQALTLVG